jgi:hypothetical protein
MILRALALSLMTAACGHLAAQVTNTSGSPMRPADLPAPAPPILAPAQAPSVLGQTAVAEQPGAPKPAVAKPKPPSAPTFKGKVSALDKVALTLSVASKDKTRVFSITPQTRFFRNGKPATFAEGEVDEDVAVVAKAARKGKQEAVTVRYGTGGGAKEKPAPKPSAKKPAHKAAAKATAAQTPKPLQ